MSDRSSSREGTPLQRRYDRLLTLMAGRRWGIQYVGFQTKRKIRLDGGAWTIVYSMHADLPKPGFTMNLTLWVPRGRGANRHGKNAPEGIRSFERDARRNGYRGKWQELGPTIRMAHYWKRLKDEKAVVAEMKRLEAIEWE
jgi:hypothetical protein